MNIFAKLAFDHIVGDTPVIPGGNELRPARPPAPPEVKADTQGPLTDLTVDGHRETMHGELERSFDNYMPSVDDFKNTIGNVLSAKIEEISGSTAASQALHRHRKA